MATSLWKGSLKLRQWLFSAVVSPDWQPSKKYEELKYGKLFTKLLKTLTLSSKGKGQGEEVCSAELDRNVAPGTRSHGRDISALKEVKRKDCVMTKDRDQAGVPSIMHVQYLADAIWLFCMINWTVCGNILEKLARVEQGSPLKSCPTLKMSWFFSRNL